MTENGLASSLPREIDHFDDTSSDEDEETKKMASCSADARTVETLEREHSKMLEICETKRNKAVAANYEQSEDSFCHTKTFLKDEDYEENHDAHAHHEHPPSLSTAIPSAVINFLLMFGLCCAYGMIMFEHDWNSQHRGMGVKMNLGSAFWCGGILSVFSKVPVAIGGTDLNPVVFLGMFTTTLAEELAKKNNLEYPDTGSRRLMDDPEHFLRSLGGSDTSNVEFCTGSHLQDHVEDCKNYHAQLTATTVFTVAMSTFVIGFIFEVLGRFKLTRMVTYVPTNIMEAFLSCVGYKVFKYALSFCNYEPKQFIPAACVGVPLYFVKTLHIGNPAIVIPAMLLIPLGIFYIILFAAGGSIDSARKDGWYFSEIENADFWAVWEDGLTPFSDAYSFAGNIKFSAWTKTLGDLPIMIIVSLLDCMLKLSSTESKLPVKADKDYEIQLYGASNIMTFLFGSPVGYMQLKFNVINFGVMGNVKDRRGGMIYALLCGVCLFWSTDLFNLLPRFFLSTLLIFAGAGFVVENLWGSRKYLSLQEWLQVIFILGIFIITGSLLYAVITGSMVAGAAFIAHYAKIPCIQGHPLKGGEVVCSQRQPLIMQYNIRHIANSCVMVIRLKGYIFFASAQKMSTWVAHHFEDEFTAKVPDYRRLRWIIFDCEHLDGLDSSASKCMAKLTKAAQVCSVHIVWSGMSKSFRQALQKCDTITSQKDWFDTLDNAMQHCHNKISERILFNQNRWVEAHPLFGTARSQTYLRIDSDPFASILPADEQRFGCPWAYCGRLHMKAYETLVWKPGSEKEIFLIYSGQVGVFHEVPEEDKKWGSPHAIYGRGWFLNRQALLHKANHTFGVALREGEILFWNELQWNRMARERPRMTNAIMKAIWTQEARDTELFEAETHSYVGAGDDDDDLEELEDRVLDEIHDHHANYDETKTSSTKGRAHLLDEKLIKNHHDHHYEEEFNAQHNELRNEIEGIVIAEACENIGLFMPVDPSEEISLPRLPIRIDDDVEIAFTTFAEKKDNGDIGIKVENIVPAMTYAGIYDFALNEIGKDFLSRTEFHQLCRRVLLAPLSQTMAKGLVEKFHEHNKKHNAHHHDTKTMDRCSFVVLMKETFNCDISADYVDGIANLWGDDHGNRVGEDVYLAVVSRFVARHMKDWLILKGTRDLRGTHAQSNLEDTDITPAMLVSANPELPMEVAEEMIWSASYCQGLGNGKSIDYRMMAAVLQAIPSKPNKIPPLPQHLSLKEYHAKLAQIDVAIVDIDDLWRGPEDEELPDWLRAAVIDFRSIDKLDVRCKYHDQQLTKLYRNRSQANPDQPLSPRRRNSIKSQASLLRESPSIQAKVWCLLEDPGSSRAASNVSVLMAFFILCSALTLFLEPLISPKNSYVSQTEKDVWFSFELFFTALFTLEYLLKLWSCTAAKPRLRFIKEPMNICDIVAVLPFYIDQIIDADKEEFRLFRIFRLLRLSRLVRLGRLAKKSATFAPIAMILVVIWGIYMQNGLKEK